MIFIKRDFTVKRKNNKKMLLHIQRYKTLKGQQQTQKCKQQQQEQPPPPTTTSYYYNNNNNNNNNITTRATATNMKQ